MTTDDLIFYFVTALQMNREAMILLGEYPKRMRILVLVKELLTIRRYLKQTSDSDMMKLPKMTDSSKETALIFARGMAIQGFYCDNHIEFLLGTVRALRITFQYGLSGYTSMSILAYGLVSKMLSLFSSQVRFFLRSLNRPVLDFISLLDPEHVERSRRGSSRSSSRSKYLEQSR